MEQLQHDRVPWSAMEPSHGSSWRVPGTRNAPAPAPAGGPGTPNPAHGTPAGDHVEEDGVLLLPHAAALLARARR